MLADERIDGGDGNARDGECVLVLLLEFGRNYAMIGGVGGIVPELEHAFGAANGEIVRLDAIEEAFAAEDIAEHGERFRVGFEGEYFARRRQNVSKNVRGVADVCANVENVAGAEEFGIALSKRPEGIFVVALVEKGSGEKRALNGAKFEDAGFLDKVVGAENGVGDEFISHGRSSATGMRCGAWIQCATKAWTAG